MSHRRSFRAPLASSVSFLMVPYSCTRTVLFCYSRFRPTRTASSLAALPVLGTWLADFTSFNLMSSSSILGCHSRPSFICANCSFFCSCCSMRILLVLLPLSFSLFLSYELCICCVACRLVISLPRICFHMLSTGSAATATLPASTGENLE